MIMTSIAVLLAACGGGQDTGSASQAGAAQSAPTALLSSVSKVDASSTTAVPSATTTTAASLYNLYVSSSTGSDTAAGTATAPLRTIQRAAKLVKPGTTVHVAPGVYAESVTSSISGTAAARIRYVSDQKWQAILKKVGSTGTYSMWSVTGGYTDIDGFQFDGTGGTTTRVGVALTGGNSSVQNSLVHDIAQNSGCDNRGGAGLVNNQYRGAAYNNYDFIGNVVHHVGGGCGWIQGIYHSSSGKIINNIVYATSQGINMGHDDHNILVMNNTLFNNTGYGVYFGGCKESYNNGCPTSGIQIHNNIIYGNRGGIQGPIPSEDIGNSVAHNLVYANSINYSLAATGSANLSKSGMIAADPQFVSYIAGGGGNYHLKSTSPVINKGQLTYAPLTDIDGKLRGSLVDMGAYEY